MARPKSKGAYAPLAAMYFMDDAILEAGTDAELLFVRCLSFLASVPSDGFITDRQLNIVGNGLRAMPRRVESLLKAGLIERVSGGFVVRSWLKWNRSADEVGRLLAKDRERKRRIPGQKPLIPSGIRVEPRRNPSSRAVQSRAVQSRHHLTVVERAHARPASPTHSTSQQRCGKGPPPRFPASTSTVRLARSSTTGGASRDLRLRSATGSPPGVTGSAATPSAPPRGPVSSRAHP